MLTFCIRRRLCFRNELRGWSQMLHRRDCSEKPDHISTLNNVFSNYYYMADQQLSKEHFLKGSSCGYGPLGMELRKNIMDQWWKSMVVSRPQVFGISTPHGIKSRAAGQERTLKLLDTEVFNFILNQKELREDQVKEALQKLLQDVGSMRTNLLQGALKHYISSVKFMNKTLPFGLAETGLCYQFPEGPPGELGCPSEVMQASLVWFCSPRTSSQWLDYWARQRLQWWRKFALGPSNFSCSGTEVGEEGNKVTRGMRLLYQFPWGPEPLETIWNLGDTELLQTHMSDHSNLKCKDGRKFVVPHVISISGNIDHGVLAYLHNSMQEVKKVDSKQRQHIRKVLKLHPSLTPVKVALVMEKGTIIDRRQVCEGLLKELLEDCIQSWPGYLDTIPTSMEQRNAKYDEMGVLFTVVITDSTLENGLVLLRSRDTTVKETMHISEIKSFLTKYIAAAEKI